MHDRLYRHPTDRVIAGVAGGLAAWLGLDPSLVRVGWVLLAIVSGGLFVLVYLVMMIVVPLPPPGWMPGRRGAGPGMRAAPAGWTADPAAGPGAWTGGPGSPPGGWTGGPASPPGGWTGDPTAPPGWGAATPPGWGPAPPEGGWAPSPDAATGPQGTPSAGAPGPPWAASSPGTPPPAHGSRSPGNAGLVLGVILVGLGVWFLVDQYVTIDWDVLWPVAIMVIGAALIAGALLRARSG